MQPLWESAFRFFKKLLDSVWKSNETILHFEALSKNSQFLCVDSEEWTLTKSLKHKLFELLCINILTSLAKQDASLEINLNIFVL